MVALEGAQYSFFPLQIPTVIGNFLFLGLLGSCLCYVFWNRAFFYLGIVTTNSFIYIQPFITIVVGWLFLGEPISPLAILGAILITAGLIAAQKSPKHKNSAGQ